LRFGFGLARAALEQRRDVERAKILSLVKPFQLTIKIFCVCGQKYAFEVQPQAGHMPVPVECPVCHVDGTNEANRLIERELSATPKLPPPSVNSLLNAAQSSLAPQMVEALKDAVVQELAAQRRELLAAQEAATAELAAIARRLEAVQAPLLERLRAYEQRVAELEAELNLQSKENRELLKMKIEMLREQVAAERGRAHSRLRFN
jgi:hypothetical protein